MIVFSFPLFFLLLPIPFLIYKCFPRSKLNRHAPLKVPDLNDFSNFQSQNKISFLNFNWFLSYLIWVLLITAAASPKIAGDAIEVPKSARDLMLAVDLSGSMQIKDFEINGKLFDRLSAVKWIAKDFIKRRDGDRIGLILFGSNAYLQAPLTFDRLTVEQLLMEAEVGLAGKETAIGDAIGLAVKQLKAFAEKKPVLILLTDGNNNSGELSPEKAADIASRAGLKIYTVAIGSKSRPNSFANLMGFVQIDEKALQKIAEKTGGHYFRAYNTEDLIKIYKKIEQLEPVEKRGTYYRQMEPIYYFPLGAALMLFVYLLLKIAPIRVLSCIF